MIRATFSRFACWLQHGDNGFGLVVMAMAPILALIFTGFF